MQQNAVTIARLVFETQTRVLQTGFQQLETNLENTISALLNCRGKIIVCGVGKSGLIGRKIAATLASTGSPAIFLNASEALHGDLGILDRQDVLVMISKSGSTAELLRILPKAKQLAIPCIGIFGKLNTPLAERMDFLLDASVQEEGSPFGLAPMASTTLTLVIGDALAAALMILKGKTEKDFAANHPAGQLGKNLLLKASDVMHTGHNLASIKPGQSIRDAVMELTRKNLGGICVCNEDLLLLGFVTDGDIRRFLSSSNDLEVKVQDIMTHKPLCCHPEMSLGQVLNLMENPARQIYVAPVTDELSGKVLGIIRMHDILNSR